MLGQVTTEMCTRGISIRPANVSDPDSVKRVSWFAVMTRVLPDRVKCLLLPVHRYTRQHPICLDMVVEEHQRRRIPGLTAWEKPGLKELPAGHCALLLHGINVQPGHHRRDIGRRPFGAAEEAVHRLKCDGPLVKLQQGATVLSCTEIGTSRVKCLYFALAHHRRESL